VPRARRVQLCLSLAAAVCFCSGPCLAEDADAAWRNLILSGQYAAASHDYANAEQTFQRALHEAERFGADDNRVATTLGSLGLAYQAGKRFPEAEAAFRRAMAILDKGDVAQNQDYADLSFNLASVLIDQGKQAAAFPLLATSLSIYEAQQGGGSPRAAAVHCLVGDAYRAARSWSEAEGPLKRCAEIREADGGVVNAGLADALYSLAVVYENQGKYALADPRYKLAEKIREKTQGIMSPGLAEVLESHAALLKAMGRDKEAGQDAALAAAIRRSQPGSRAARPH
jgi:tetratricopeptide (TPR) repeat protein